MSSTHDFAPYDAPRHRFYVWQVGLAGIGCTSDLLLTADSYEAALRVMDAACTYDKEVPISHRIVDTARANNKERTDEV